MGLFKKIKEAWLASMSFDNLDDAFYEELEEALILADVGVETASDAVQQLRKRVYQKLLTRADEVKEALRDILARRKVDPLGEELLRTFQEIQLGRKRTDALRALTLRVRQADLTAAINAIIQAEELGVSIAQILHIQSDMQRNKRFMLAEKLANEASVKIIIPIILLILPAVFLVLVGPLALRAAAFFR